MNVKRLRLRETCLELLLAESEPVSPCGPSRDLCQSRSTFLMSPALNLPQQSQGQSQQPQCTPEIPALGDTGKKIRCPWSSLATKSVLSQAGLHETLFQSNIKVFGLVQFFVCLFSIVKKHQAKLPKETHWSGEFSNARECISPKRSSFPGVCLCRQRVLSIVMLMKQLYTEIERNCLSEQFQIVF